MPSARLGLRVSRFHLPLMRLGLCLDCEVCFEIGIDTCPACGSETWVPLARFLETGGAQRMVHIVESLTRSASGPDDASEVRHFVIVARDRPTLYRHFAEALAGNQTITVLLDRRRSDRRKSTRVMSLDRGGTLLGRAERRRGDRRWRTIDEQLRVMGWAVVRHAATAALT